MANVFRDNGSTGRVKVPWNGEMGIDGTEHVYAIAHATLTNKTSYRIGCDEYGYLTAAITGNTSRVFRVGVATAATTTGNVAKLIVRGYVSSMVTPSLSMAVGEALVITAGAIADGAADFGDLVTQFAICTTATTTKTHCSCLLLGKYITASG